LAGSAETLLSSAAFGRDAHAASAPSLDVMPLTSEASAGAFRKPPEESRRPLERNGPGGDLCA
jgi:hypothetical protein